MSFIYVMLIVIGIFGLQLLGMNVFNVVMFYVLPVGTLLVSIFLPIAMINGLKRSKKKYTKIYGIITVCIAVFTYIGSEYIEYRTTYYAGGSYIERGLIGEHDEDYTWIGNWTYQNEDGEEVKFTFINYIKFKLDNANTNIIDRNGNEEKIDTKGYLNYIRVVLNFIILIGITLFWITTILKNISRCSRCDYYLLEKRIYKFFGDDYEEEVKGLKERIKDNNEIEAYIVKPKKQGLFKTVNSVYIKYCPECSEGEINVYRRVGNNDKGEVLDNFKVDATKLNEIFKFR